MKKDPKIEALVRTMTGLTRYESWIFMQYVLGCLSDVVSSKDWNRSLAEATDLLREELMKRASKKAPAGNVKATKGRAAPESIAAGIGPECAGKL